MKLPGPSGPIVSAPVAPTAWRRQEDALAERIIGPFTPRSRRRSAVSRILPRDFDRVAAGDLAEAVAAPTAWCADRLTVAPAPTA